MWFLYVFCAVFGPCMAVVCRRVKRDWRKEAPKMKAIRTIRQAERTGDQASVVAAMRDLTSR